MLFLLDKVILKQRLKIKSSIVDVNNCLNGILPAFNSLHKALSSGFYLVDIFQNCFSLTLQIKKSMISSALTLKNSIKSLKAFYKIPKLLSLYQMLVLKIMLLHQSLILIVVIISWLGLSIMLSISLQQRLNYSLSGVESTKQSMLQI